MYSISARIESFCKWCESEYIDPVNVRGNEVYITMCDASKIVVSFEFDDSYASVYFRDSSGDIIFMPQFLSIESMEDEEELTQFISEVFVCCC